MPESASQADIFFEVGSYAPPDLRVTAFRGVEGVSQLFDFQVELAIEDPIVLEDVVGQVAKLYWAAGDETRHVHGIVATLEESGRAGRFHCYRARLVPKVWTTGLRRDCRIFQDVTVKDVIQKVLEGAGFALNTDFSLELGSHPTREYCVQYNESDWDFVCRLAEDEGIFYFFDHGEDGAKLVWADQKSIHTPIPGTPEVVFKEPSAMVEGEEAVYRFSWSSGVRSNKATLRDYDFKKPSLLLESTAAGSPSDLEVYSYPGGYRVPGDGSGIATWRLEMFAAARDQGRAESDCRRMASGFKFTLTGHPNDARDCEYLITRVEHWGVQRASLEEAAADGGQPAPPYGNALECIPSSVPFRPERLTPKPRIEGGQPAKVVGPSGEEVHVDEYGRVKVHFYWDRLGAENDTASCWVRVSQGWAGEGWGMVFLPRIGQEVIVGFMDGDPDFPIVMGRVYNGLNPHPYELPGEKTKSTIKSNSSPGGGGFNEIRFEDAAGAEQIYVHAQFNMDSEILNDRTVKVGNDETHEVGRDRTLTVKRDQKFEVVRDQTGKVGSNDTLTVVKDQTKDVGANLTITVGGNRSETVRGDSIVDVTKTFALKVGQAANVDFKDILVEKVAKDHSSEVSGGSVRTVSKDDEWTISGASKVSVGKEQTVEVGETYGLTVTKAATMKAKTITVEADDEITIKTGEASITMKKDGTITIKGKDVKVDANSNVDMKAGSNMTIKGSTTKVD